MLGKLTKKEINELLSKQFIGRIGCQSDGTMYIIPINYKYSDNAIYAYSAVGKKIKTMRKNPKVCFQVDEIIDTFTWKSVLLWGEYEELTETQMRQQAIQRLVHWMMPLTNLPSQHPWHGITEKEMDIDVSVPIIVYRIVIKKSIGRFEVHEQD
jgi:hypothetical protein